MKSELDPGSVWPLAPASSVGAEGGLDVLTRMAAHSPEQLLSRFLLLLATMFLPLGWCSGGDCTVEIRDGRCFPLCLIEEWQQWSGHAGSFIGCSTTSTPVLLVLRPGGEICLHPLGPLNTKIPPDTFTFSS